MQIYRLLLVVGAMFAAQTLLPVAAAVLDSGPNGFTVQEGAHFSQPPEKVYAALIQPAQWWSGAHSYSGSATNFTFDAKAGGCWCETLPGGGSALHMVVLYLEPGKALRLRGALGPLQSLGVTGSMTWMLRPAGKETDLTLTYAVGGYAGGGFVELAKGVDGVLSQQVGRLTLYVETGMPEPQP